MPGKTALSVMPRTVGARAKRSEPSFVTEFDRVEARLTESHRYRGAKSMHERHDEGEQSKEETKER